MNELSAFSAVVQAWTPPSCPWWSCHQLAPWAPLCNSSHCHPRDLYSRSTIRLLLAHCHSIQLPWSLIWEDNSASKGMYMSHVQLHSVEKLTRHLPFIHCCWYPVPLVHLLLPKTVGEPLCLATWLKCHSLQHWWLILQLHLMKVGGHW